MSVTRHSKMESAHPRSNRLWKINVPISSLVRSLIITSIMFKDGLNKCAGGRRLNKSFPEKMLFFLDVSVFFSSWAARGSRTNPGETKQNQKKTSVKKCKFFKHPESWHKVCSPSSKNHLFENSLGGISEHVFLREIERKAKIQYRR